MSIKGELPRRPSSVPIMSSPSSSRSSSPCGVLGLYPRAYTPLTHLAYGGPYNEIPNSPGSIARHVLNEGRPRRPRGPTALAFYPTTQPMLDIFYQTTKHGPQNGFVVLLVEKGNDPEEVERVVMGRHGSQGITKQTAEAAVFFCDGAGVEWIVDRPVPGAGPGEGGELSVAMRRWVERVMDSGVTGEAISVPLEEDGQIARRVRGQGCYPRQRNKNAPLSDAELVERPVMFVVRRAASHPPGEGAIEGDGKSLLVLVVEGYSPEQIEKDVLARLELPDDEVGLMLVFGRGEEGVQTFR